MALHTSVREAYMLGRGYRESVRLHLQHWLCGERLGWQLHPLIDTSKNDLSIIDIGCGNACWLLELARHRPETWRLHGIDVASPNFPASGYLPSNVTLQQCDAFDDIPEELCGQFDVVHIRFFCLVIKGGEPGPLTKNLLKLLKPGGYLQWDEADCASFSTHTPSEHVSDAQAALLLDRWQTFTQKSGLSFDWLSDLPGLLRSHDLQVLDGFRSPITDDLRKPSTDNLVLGLEEMGHLASIRDPWLLGTPEEFEALFVSLMEDVRRGVTISMDMVVALGQKQT